MLTHLVVLAATTMAVDKEVSFKGYGGIDLKGTLALPSSGTKHPAVLLLPGSGPTDRNGNQPPTLVTDLLKQIAEGLAKQGIASFRFDKRAAHANSAIWPKDATKLDDFFKFEAFAGDAEAAVRVLKSRPEVDAARVGMAGHSEGGLITAYVAQRSPKSLKAIALLGTAGRTLDLVLKDQIEALLVMQGASNEVKAQYMANLGEAIDQVRKTGTSPKNVLPGLQPLFSPGTAKLLQSYFTINPVKAVSAYSGPVLLLQGQMDSQISVSKDFPLLDKALKSRKNAVTTSAAIPDASHNLKKVEKISDPGISGPVVPEALNAVMSYFKKGL